MRLFGCLGAIDNFYYKKIEMKIKKKNSSVFLDSCDVFNSVVCKVMKKKFKFFEKYKYAK